MKKFISILMLVAFSFVWTAPSYAASQTWAATAATNVFETAANWIGAAVPGATAGTTNTDTVSYVNAGGGFVAPVNDLNRNFQNITFDTAAAAAYTFGTVGGNILLLTSAGTIQTTATVVTNQIVNAPLSIQAAGGTYAFSSNAAATLLSFGGGITGAVAGATVLTITGTNTGNNTISGIIANGTATTMAITKAGVGTWILSGANTYTGATTIGAGVVNIQNATALGTVAGATSVTNLAALQIQGGIAVGAEGLTLNGLGVGSVGGALRSISGANSMASAITLGSASRINSDTNAVALTLSGTVDNGGFLLTDGGIGNITHSGIISGAGGLTVDSTVNGTVTLTGANTYAGVTTVSSGVLNIQNATALGTVAGATSVTAGAALQIQGGIAVGAEGLTLNGTGIAADGALRNISGTNSYSGAVTLGAASRINSDAGTLTVSGALANGGFLLTTGGAGAITYSGIISGAGALTKDGAGTDILSGANTYTGITTVSAGVLNIQNATALGTVAGATSVTAGAALQIQGGIAVGAEGLTLNGTGIAADGALRNISGTNSYSGAVTLGAASRINTDAGTTTLSGAIGNGGFLLTAGGAGNTTLSGIISGAGGLTKDGAGTLNLGGVNTYTGLTTVSAGTLSIPNTAAVGGALTLAAASTLALGGNTFTVPGVVTTSATTSIISMTANSSTSFGNIVSSLAIPVIFAGTTVDVNVVGALASGTALRILDGAATGAQVAISVTDNSVRYNFAGSMAAGDISITPTSVALATIATTGNNLSVATSLDGSAATATGDFLTVQNALSVLPTESALDAAYAQLDPEVNAGVTGMSFTALNEGLGATLGRLSEVRSSKDDEAKSGVSTGDGDLAHNVWIKGFGTLSDQDLRSGVEGYEADVWGTALGFDKLVNDYTRLGLSGGFAGGDVDSKGNANKTGIESYQGTIYGSYEPDSPWYFNGAFSFAWNEYDGERYVSFGTINRQAAADYAGQQYSVYGDANYEIQQGDWTITPTASLQYVHLALDGYTETGADSLNLTVDSQGYDFLQSGLGAKMAWDFAGNGGTWTPEIRAKWLYDFIGDKQQTTSSFTGGGASFSTNGADPAQHSFDLGAGLTFLSAKNVEVSFNYDYEVKEDFNSHSGVLMVKYAY